MKAIKQSKSIAELAGNPLLLTMMAILNRHQELPRQRADLYEQAARLLLHQWDFERTLKDFPGLSDEIGLREKTDILRSVAYAMQTGLGRLGPLSRPTATARKDGRDNGPILQSNYIDGTTLTSLIEDYLHTELRFEQSRAVARALVEQLRTRNFILCYLGADSYAFVHRTFLEYFCAADIVHQFNIAKTLQEQDLIALFDAHCRDDDWHEVLRLICGQIDEQFVGRIIKRLATRTDLEQWDGKTPLPELPLAISCLSEARQRQRLHNAGHTLLQIVIRIFEKPGGTESFHDDLHEAYENLGTQWPHQYRIADCAMRIAESFKRSYWAANFWPKFVAEVFSFRPVIEKMVETGIWNLRSGAVRTLAKNWADEDTRKLLAQRAIQDPDQTTRGAACSAFGKMHSEFGRILPTRDLNGGYPYLDPLQPVPRDHIEKAAEKAGVRPEDIDAQVASLSAHFGWDITVGAKK